MPVILQETLSYFDVSAEGVTTNHDGMESILPIANEDPGDGYDLCCFLRT